MTKWEYKFKMWERPIIELGTDAEWFDTIGRLNEMGAEGWELIEMKSYFSAVNASFWTSWKRPVA